MNDRAESPRCPDAIVVVPGIGGSELKRGDDVIWGASLKVAVAGLVTGQLFDDLRGELVPGGLVRLPTNLPGIGRFDPYQRLMRTVRELAVHRAAVLEFPYDWRGSIVDSAAALAEAAGEHLERWRHHPSGSAESLLSLVCHSMGGLVARYYAEVLGDRSQIRQIITLGTPFGGSVKALRLLADGRLLKAGLLSEKLRRLARELPGVHDLLPSYPALATRTGRCVPAAADLVAAGATADLVDRAASARRRVEEAIARGRASSCPIERQDPGSAVHAAGQTS